MQPAQDAEGRRAVSAPSITATLFPKAAATRAALKPALPPPMQIKIVGRRDRALEDY